MYVRNLKISRLKLLRDFELSFLDASGNPRMWTVIIGENGTGKTSILQAIALASAGGLHANALGGSVVAVLRDRRSNEPMSIDVEFGFSKKFHALRWYPQRSRSTLPPDPPILHAHVGIASPQKGTRGKKRVERGSVRASSRFVGEAWAAVAPEATNGVPADPLAESRDIAAGYWFVAGYGVNRSLPDEAKPAELQNPSIDRMRPLFPHSGMIGTGFAWHFRGKPAKAQLFSKILKQALLTHADLLPAIKDLELRGHGGVRSTKDLLERDRFHQMVGDTRMKVPASALSHGYQSTIAWVADLVGHIVWEVEEDIGPDEMEGVVLIDEIDLYLHPRWQVSLIAALRATFPRIQFIATTHSPAALVGLRTDRDEIVRLGFQERTGDVVKIDVREGEARGPDPRLMTGSDIYDRYFGMPDAFLNPLGGELRDYVAIASNPFRTDEEEIELQRLATILTGAGVPLTYRPVPRMDP
jgi:hypothetical protein